MPKVFQYGPHVEQRIRISLPPRCEQKVPVAALYHGGYWKQQWTIDNTPITSIVPDLLKLGFAVVEVEYRRRDDEGGGWPGTNNDAMLALNSLPDVAPDECATLDLTNVTLIGHSAGGCLVLWLAAQELLAVRLALVVAVAPVCDLNEAYHLRLSDEGDAVERYMKCTPETEEGLAHYAKASPAELVPNIQAPLLLAIGTKDVDVPFQMVQDFYQDCVTERGADIPLRLLNIDEADHYNILTSGHDAWNNVLAEIMDLLGIGLSQ